MPPDSFDELIFDQEIIEGLIEQIPESKDIHNVMQGRAMDEMLEIKDVIRYVFSGNPYPASSALQIMAMDSQADSSMGPEQTITEAAKMFNEVIMTKKTVNEVTVIEVINDYASYLWMLSCNQATDFQSNQRPLSPVLAEGKQLLVLEGKLPQGLSVKGDHSMVGTLISVTKATDFDVQSPNIFEFKWH
jgi:hypothetical protein